MTSNFFTNIQYKVPLLDQEFSTINIVDSEKRKRAQIYGVINILFPQVTFFDFFTKDSIDILVISLKIARILNLYEVTLDTIFIAFFFYKSPFTTFLENEGILQNEAIYNKIKQMPYNFNITSKTVFNSFFSNIYTYISFLFKKKLNKNKFKLTSELMIFLENVSEIARQTYKTPLVSLKILFLILIEKQQGILIKQLFKNEEDWYIFRFKILKDLFFEEYPIKKYIEKPQLQYAYIFRTLMNPYQFEKLKTFIKTKLYKRIVVAVDRFRTIIIQSILNKKNKADITNFFEDELQNSEQINQNRKYLYH